MTATRGSLLAITATITLHLSAAQCGYQCSGGDTLNGAMCDTPAASQLVCSSPWVLSGNRCKQQLCGAGTTPGADAFNAYCCFQNFVGYPINFNGGYTIVSC